MYTTSCNIQLVQRGPLLAQGLAHAWVRTCAPDLSCWSYELPATANQVCIVTIRLANGVADVLLRDNCVAALSATATSDQKPHVSTSSVMLAREPRSTNNLPYLQAGAACGRIRATPAAPATPASASASAAACGAGSLSRNSTNSA